MYWITRDDSTVRLPKNYNLWARCPMWHEAGYYSTKRRGGKTWMGTLTPRAIKELGLPILEPCGIMRIESISIKVKEMG